MIPPTSRRGGDGAEIIYALRNTDSLAKKIATEFENAGQNVRKYYQRRLPSDSSKDYYYVIRNTPNNETLIVEYGLKPGVANVLIDYILKTKNNKLTRALAETIAGQWKRLKIETVEEAMLAAEKEYKKSKKIVGTKSAIKKEEKLPEWFDKEIKKQEVSEEEKNEMENILKEYR